MRGGADGARSGVIVVGVDPPAGRAGDACGIVVAGRADGTLFVLADASVERG